MIKSLEKIIIAADHVCDYIDYPGTDDLLCKAHLKKFLFQCIKICNVSEENRNKSFFDLLKNHVNDILEKDERKKGTDNIFIISGSYDEGDIEYRCIDTDHMEIDIINTAIYYADMYQLLTDESINEISKKPLMNWKVKLKTSQIG